MIWRLVASLPCILFFLIYLDWTIASASISHYGKGLLLKQSGSNLTSSETTQTNEQFRRIDYV